MTAAASECKAFILEVRRFCFHGTAVMLPQMYHIEYPLAYCDCAASPPLTNAVCSV